MSQQPNLRKKPAIEQTASLAGPGLARSEVDPLRPSCAIQPDPTDIALIAAQMAARCPEKNPLAFLSDAYELWQKAEQLIKQHRTSHETTLAAAAQKEQGVEREEPPGLFEDYWNEPVSFSDMISKGLVPKALGEKGREGGGAASIGDKALKKSLRQFFAKCQPVPPVLSSLEEPTGGLPSDELSTRFLKDILQQRTMPRETFKAFLAWRSSRRKNKLQLGLASAQSTTTPTSDEHKSILDLVSPFPLDHRHTWVHCSADAELSGEKRSTEFLKIEAGPWDGHCILITKPKGVRLSELGRLKVEPNQRGAYLVLKRQGQTEVMRWDPESEPDSKESYDK